MIDNWRDLKVGQFLQLLDIDENDEDRVFQMVAILNNESIDQTLDRQLADVKADIAKLEFLNEKPKVVRAKGKYKLGDTTYVLMSEPAEVTLAQYIDFGNTSKETKHIAEILSIVLIPEGHEYGQGYKFDKVVQDIETYMGFEDANAISAFFFGLWLLYLKRGVKEARKALKKAVREKVITKEEAAETLETMQEALTPIIGFRL